LSQHVKTFARVALLLLVTWPAALPGSPADRKIEEVARGSFNFRTVLARRVSVESRNGIVTLSGLVEDQGDKRLAADTIANVPGIVGVNNDIIVQWSVPEFSDPWIALKVRRGLVVKANVSSATTTVSVKDGIVTLTGTTISAAQRELTTACAQEVAQVKSVRNELVVTASTAPSATMDEIIDDGSITSQVKHALLTNQSTSTMKTKVETTDGVVAVSGEVATDAEKAFITKLAESVRGVKSVTNKIIVKA
jgi:hyperosmotically inducible periplasmic protein